MRSRSAAASAALVAVLPLVGVHAATAAPAARAAWPVPGLGCAATTINGLDLTDRVGQLLMIGVPVDDAGGARSVIASYKVGSIFLAGRSYRSVDSIRDTADKLVAFTKRWSGVAGYVAVDQEGGAVQSLRGPGFAAIPSALRQGAMTRTAMRTQAAAWSNQLRAAGITLDLAPVADTVTVVPAAANPPIGAFHREYGDDPATAARAIETIVPILQDRDVSATLKHFPGLGRVRYNTDTSTLARDSVATVDDPNLAPFEAGINAGARAVMMSSARYPLLDPTLPAVLSRRIVTGLLQQRLGFDGLVMTDDIGSAAALRGVPLGDRAIRFIDAGGQIVLSVRTSDAAPLSRALIDRAEADPIFRRRIDAAATRVIQSKINAGLLTCAL